MSLWASTTAPKVQLDAADGDEAESVRVLFRERVSSPCGEDGEVEPAGHPPGGGGCAALFPSSRCMEQNRTTEHTVYVYGSELGGQVMYVVLSPPTYEILLRLNVHVEASSVVLAPHNVHAIEPAVDL
jgi:hypothetical protein